MSGNVSLEGNSIMQVGLVPCDIAGNSTKRRPARCPICTLTPTVPTETRTRQATQKNGRRGANRSKPQGRPTGSQSLEFTCLTPVDLLFLQQAALRGDPIVSDQNDTMTAVFLGNEAKENVYRVNTEWDDCSGHGLAMSNAVLDTLSITGSVDTGILTATGNLIGDAPTKISGATEKTVPYLELDGFLFSEAYAQLCVDDTEQEWGKTPLNCTFAGFTLDVANNTQQKPVSCGQIVAPGKRSVTLNVVLCFDDVAWEQYCAMSDEGKDGKKFVELKFLDSCTNSNWRFKMCGRWQGGQVTPSNGVNTITLTMIAENAPGLDADYESVVYIDYTDNPEFDPEACVHLAYDDFNGDDGDSVTGTGFDYHYDEGAYDSVFGAWVENGDGQAVLSTGTFGRLSTEISCTDFTQSSQYIIKDEDSGGYVGQYFYTDMGYLWVYYRPGQDTVYMSVQGSGIVASSPLNVGDDETIAFTMCVSQDGDYVATVNGVELTYAAGADPNSVANPNWQMSVPDTTNACLDYVEVA